MKSLGGAGFKAARLAVYKLSSSLHQPLLVLASTAANRHVTLRFGCAQREDVIQALAWYRIIADDLQQTLVQVVHGAQEGDGLIMVLSVDALGGVAGGQPVSDWNTCEAGLVFKPAAVVWRELLSHLDVVVLLEQLIAAHTAKYPAEGPIRAR